jgi:hypothetical protein
MVPGHVGLGLGPTSALRYTLDCVVLSLERDAGGENDAEAVEELSQVRLARWYQVT